MDLQKAKGPDRSLCVINCAISPMTRFSGRLCALVSSRKFLGKGSRSGPIFAMPDPALQLQARSRAPMRKAGVGYSDRRIRIGGSDRIIDIGPHPPTVAKGKRESK